MAINYSYDKGTETYINFTADGQEHEVLASYDEKANCFRFTYNGTEYCTMG